MILIARALALAAAPLLAACVQPSGGAQIILLGESSQAGSDAVQEANVAVQNAISTANCRAISVGGYGAAANVPPDSAGSLIPGGGLIIGVPVLVDCPAGTKLLPNGVKAP